MIQNVLVISMVCNFIILFYLYLNMKILKENEAVIISILDNMDRAYTTLQEKIEAIEK